MPSELNAVVSSVDPSCRTSRLMLEALASSHTKPPGLSIRSPCCSSISLGNFYNTPDFPEEYRSEAKKFGGILDDYRENASMLKWTMLAPAFVIAPGVRTGMYFESKDTPAGGFVSAEDFAVALIDEAVAPKHMRQRFTVASQDEAAAQG